MKHLNQALAANSAANAEDVVATKLFLRHQGHYAPPKSGISQFPDRALFDAIKAFQQSQGLKVDGVMNPEGETETAIKAQAQQLQSMGRNGDTILAHINPAEAKLLNDITDGGSINPDTGLPEFFFGDFFCGLSDSFSSIGTSMSDSFSSFGDSMSSFGDSFSSGLSDIGNSVSSNLDSTFGKVFSDQVGNFAGGLTSRVAGKYVSNKIGKKVGGPLGGLLGDTVGGAVGNTLGDTVSGAFKPSQSLGAGLTDNLKPSVAAQSNTTQSLSTPAATRPSMSPPTPTKTQQSRGMSSHGLGMGEKPQPKPQPAPPKPEPMPSLKGLNIPQPAQPKPVSQAALKSVIADFKAKQQQGGIQNLLQNGPTQNANAKPLGTAPALTPEASASNARLAAASAKTTDHSLLKRDVTDALKTGGAQAQAEVRDLTQQMDQLQPGSGTKLAQEVGLKPVMSGGSGQKILQGGSGQDALSKDAAQSKQPSFKDAIAKRESDGQPNDGYGAVNWDKDSNKTKGAYGRYQMRKPALEDAGYMDKNGNWNGTDGINSHTDFLNSPKTQEKAYDTYLRKTEGYLKNNGASKHIGQKIEGKKAKIKVTRSGLLGAANRQGKGKVNEYLKHLKANDWKSDENTFGENKDMFLSIETRLREFQDIQLP